MLEANYVPHLHHRVIACELCVESCVLCHLCDYVNHCNTSTILRPGMALTSVITSVSNNYFLQSTGLCE